MSLRFKMRDGAAPGRRVMRTRDDVAEKTQVAVYKGAHFVAERNGEDLIIYSIGTDGGAGVTLRNSTSTSDAPKAVRDSLKSIRDNIATTAAVNKTAGDFWAQQRAAQDAVHK
jgi:hypothetical protein